MAEQGIGDPNSIRKTTVVEAEQGIAWKVFTEKMGAWWPLAYYKIGKAIAVGTQLLSLASEAAGLSAVKTRAPVNGAACLCGSRRRVWCSHGISMPTGSMTQP